MAYDHIKRCLQLAEKDMLEAVASREDCKALIVHLSSISKPSDGGPKLLVLFARMATSVCDWLEGDLRIEIVGDGDVSVVELMTELGGGMRERVFSAFPMNVPLTEFARAVERVPHMIEPLRIQLKTPRRLVFVVTDAVRRSSYPPENVEIGDDSLFLVPNAGRVPHIPIVDMGSKKK
jgi:hypothetical protein